MNPKTDDKIKKSAFNLMNLRLQECLLNLINDLCEHTSTEKSYTEDKEFLQLKLEFFKLTKELSSEMDKSLGERENYLSQLEALREKLIKLAKPIFLFEKNISLAELKIVEKLKPFVFDKIKSFNFDIGSVLLDCENFLEASSSDIEAQYAKAQLLSCFPHYATKTAFEDYIKKSLGYLFELSVSEFLTTGLNILKSDYAPFETVDISSSYPLISEEITEIWNMDFNEKTAKELEELLSCVDDTRMTYESITSDYNMLFNNINFLIAIAKYCTDKEQLFEDDFELKDLFYSACELIDSNTAEAFKDTIIEASEKRIEAIFEKVQAETESFEKYYHKGFVENSNSNEEFSEKTSIFIQLMGAITELYTAELTDYILDLNYLFAHSDSENAVFSTDEEIESTINEFIDFTREINNKYPSATIKMLKQNFIKHIPSPYNNAEALKYIQNSIDAIKDSVALTIALNNLGNLFEQTGFIDNDTDSCGCGHEHHTHHHHNADCSCGHDHKHHHNNCGCGHHH